MAVRLVLLTTVLVAFGAGPVAHADEPPHVCTLIGCASGITLDLQALRTVPNASSVTVCLNDRCRRTSIGTVNGQRGTLRRDDGRLDGKRPASVTLVVRRRDGRVLLRATRVVRLQAVWPNGVDCPPPCWVRKLTLDADQQLLRVAA